MRRTGIFVFMAVMGAVGCDGSLPTGAAAGADGKADQVDPTGHDHQGALVIEVPATNPPYVGSFDLSYRGVAVQPGTPTHFPKGTGCLSLSNLMQDCTVSIASDQTTTYKLALLHPHWDPAAFEVDFGPEWVMTLTRDGKRLMSAIARAPIDTPTHSLPGDFHVEVIGLGVFPPMDLSVAGGVVKDIDLTADKRATIHVVPPLSRSFANSSCSRGNQLVQRTTDGRVADSAPLAAQSEERYRVFPLVAADASHYEISTGDLTTPLTVTAGQTVDFKLKRIDVNNVLIKRGDGSTYYVKGTYVISRKDPVSGSFQPAFGGCSSSTPSGLDVVPGVYKITTTWSTAEGPDSQEDTLDLR